eukprot:7287050-Pyramimonas_sp.AAC.1
MRLSREALRKLGGRLTSGEFNPPPLLVICGRPFVRVEPSQQLAEVTEMRRNDPMGVMAHRVRAGWQRGMSTREGVQPEGRRSTSRQWQKIGLPY